MMMIKMCVYVLEASDSMLVMKYVLHFVEKRTNSKSEECEAFYVSMNMWKYYVYEKVCLWKLTNNKISPSQQ